MKQQFGHLRFWPPRWGNTSNSSNAPSNRVIPRQAYSGCPSSVWKYATIIGEFTSSVLFGSPRSHTLQISVSQLSDLRADLGLSRTWSQGRTTSQCWGMVSISVALGPTSINLLASSKASRPLFQGLPHKGAEDRRKRSCGPAALLRAVVGPPHPTLRCSAPHLKIHTDRPHPTLRLVGDNKRFFFVSPLDRRPKTMWRWYSEGEDGTLEVVKPW